MDRRWSQEQPRSQRNHWLLSGLGRRQMELLVPGEHDGELEKGSGLSRLRAGKVAPHLGSPGGQGLHLPLSLPTKVLSKSPASREQTVLRFQTLACTLAWALHMHRHPGRQAALRESTQRDSVRPSWERERKSGTSRYGEEQI